jgi:protein-S-isoprenylcysteine O-methyltransferase Ste14
MGRGIMRYIVTGSVAFLLFIVFDYFTLYNKEAEKKLFGIAGLLIFIYSAIMSIITSQIIRIPVAVRIAAGGLWVMFIFLLIYSLFLELPFVKTYGEKEHSRDLVDTGTYALCRHPGVLWFGLMFLSAFLTTGAVLIAIGGFIWTIIDVFHVYLQEKIFFCKMFNGYENYMKTTPMLIPDSNSIKKCKDTIFRRWG